MRRNFHCPVCRALYLFLVCNLLGAAVSAAAWRQEAYLWQRQWTPQVVASVSDSQTFLDGIQLLVAEVGWQSGKPQIFRTRMDAAALASLQAEITYVIRIAPYSGAFAQEGEPIEAITALVSDLLRSAAESGIHVAGVQIDFDCAESRLGDYRQWLLAIAQTLRRTAPDVRLSFTSLPSWLKHRRAFRKLAAVADSFVLQVHSLERPKDYGSPITLCDPRRSQEWAGQAAKIGKPFLVALPTYGYEVVFDKSGQFTALVAEGERPDWQEGTQVQVVRSDPHAMADLARSLAGSPPPGCMGIIWFRLPVGGDRLNWNMHTFKVVAGGGVPVSSLRSGIEWSAGGDALARIFLENTGDTSLPFPAVVTLSWEGQAGVFPVAWDSAGIFAMSLDRSGQHARISTQGLSPSASIAPGQRVELGWIRFNKPVATTACHHDS